MVGVNSATDMHSWKPSTWEIYKHTHVQDIKVLLQYKIINWKV